MKHKPNLFIVGAAKAGTTSLYYYLSQHPDVYMCPIKEPNYFGADIDMSKFRDDYKKAVYLNEKKYLSQTKLKPLHNAFISSLENYEALYREAGSQKILGEASTSYLYSTLAANEIKHYNPDAKIIVVLRDPIERLISHYKMHFAGKGQKEKNIIKGVKKDFESEKKGYGISNLYVELSLYYDQIQRYLNEFNCSQLLFIDFKDLIRDTKNTMNKVCAFLEIEPYVSIQAEVHNPTRMRPTILQFLKKIIPQSIIQKINIKHSLFYKTSIPVFIDSEGEQFLDSLFREDWKKTNSIISL